MKRCVVTDKFLYYIRQQIFVDNAIQSLHYYSYGVNNLSLLKFIKGTKNGVFKES